MKLFTRLLKPLGTLGVLAAFLAGTGTAQAQSSQTWRYRFAGYSSGTTTYTPNPGSAQIISVPDNDEGLSTALPIGFNFVFNGTTMSHFILSTNGWIKVGTSAAMTVPSSELPGGGYASASGAYVQAYGLSALLSDTAADDNIISPFNIDLWDSAATAPLDAFTYQVSGTVGSRVCTIQWKQRRDFPTTGAPQIYRGVNFQVKLYEGTNAIQFVYGRFTGSTGSGSSTYAIPWLAGVGIKGHIADATYPDNMLVLRKGTTTAWGSNTVAYNLGGLSGSTSQGFNVLSHNTTTPWAANPALLPTIGQFYQFTPDSPFATPLLYAPITVSNALNTFTPVTGGTVVSVADFDNSNSSEQAIGFNFGFGLTSVSHFIVNTNGYLKLGTTGMSAPTSTLFVSSDATAPGAGVGPLFSRAASDVNLLVPFNTDLIGGTGTPEIRYVVTGSSPSRVCTIQWTNFRDQVSNATDAPTASQQLFTNITFQVKLYEANGLIEYVYGPFTSTGNVNRKQINIGIKGANDGIPQIVAGNPGTGLGGINWSRIIYSNFAFLNSFLVGNDPTLIPESGRTLGFPFTLANDLRADIVYTLGKLPTPYANPTNIKGVVRNVGTNDYAGGGTATLTLSGANSGSGTATIPALLSGETVELDFGNFSPTNAGNTNVTLSVPSDDNIGNNNKTWVMNVNTNTYSYKDPSQANVGGVGYNTGTGAFVAKFNSNATNTLNSVKVDFNGVGGRQYQLVVYGDASGHPGQLRYISPVYTSPIGGGTAVLAICPSLSVSGDFYIGVKQSVAGSNVGFAYQAENPIRSGTFWSTSPATNAGATAGDATSGWTDFAATSSPFRFSVEALLEVVAGPPSCATVTSPINASTYQNTTPTLAWGAGAGNSPTSYDVYFGTSTTPPLLVSNFCGNTYSPGALTPNTTYYWKVVARNVAGNATGCATWSFTTAPLPTNNECTAPTLLAPCAAAVTSFTNNATQTLAAGTCAGDANDDVWFSFTANAATHRISVSPIDLALDPVIELRSSVGCPGTYLACSNLRPAGFGEDLSVTGLTPGTVYRIRVYGFGAAGTEGRFTIRITTDGGWLGTTSTDWNTASNWCSGTVPATTSTVLVRIAPNQPVLNTSAQIRNLSVDANATLTLGSGVLLNVRSDGTTGGSLTGAGTITGGTLRLSTAGTTVGQSINYTGSVDDIQLANNTNVTVVSGSNLQVKKSLTFFSATPLVNNGNVTFKSSASTTGYVGPFTGGSTYAGTGTMTQERYLASPARWVFLGAPVSNATLNQWSEVNPVIFPLNNASVFWFQETDSSRTVVNGGAVAEINGWRVPTSLVNGINPGAALRGYRAYVRSSFLTGPSPVVSVFGSPYVGTVTATLTKTAGQYYGGGYNLISNPYMSAINFDLVTKGSGVNNAFFVYNGAAGNYQVYVGSGGFGEGVALNAPGPNPNHIPSSQSFFVRTATNNSTITFNETNKVANGAASFYRTGPVADRLRIAARNAAGNKDEAVIRFRQGASEGFDAQADAGALGADHISVSSVITGSTETMDVNTLPPLGARRSVFLSVRATSNGTYALDFSELESFESYMDLLLVDHLTGTTTNLRNQASYTFQVSSNPASQGTRRFEVIFNDARVTAVKPTVGGPALSAWPNPASADQRIMVSVSGTLTGAADLQVFDAAGRLMHTQQVVLSGDANQAHELTASLAAGTYTVRCTTASAAMSTRLVVNK